MAEAMNPETSKKQKVQRYEDIDYNSTSHVKKARRSVNSSYTNPKLIEFCLPNQVNNLVDLQYPKRVKRDHTESFSDGRRRRKMRTSRSEEKMNSFQQQTSLADLQTDSKGSRLENKLQPARKSSGKDAVVSEKPKKGAAKSSKATEMCTSGSGKAGQSCSDVSDNESSKPQKDAGTLAEYSPSIKNKFTSASQKEMNEKNFGTVAESGNSNKTRKKEMGEKDSRAIAEPGSSKKQKFTSVKKKESCEKDSGIATKSGNSNKQKFTLMRKKENGEEDSGTLEESINSKKKKLSIVRKKEIVVKDSETVAESGYSKKKLSTVRKKEIGESSKQQSKRGLHESNDPLALLMMMEGQPGSKAGSSIPFTSTQPEESDMATDEESEGMSDWEEVHDHSLADRSQIPSGPVEITLELPDILKHKKRY